jgi:hypothetical protein
MSTHLLAFKHSVMMEQHRDGPAEEQTHAALKPLHLILYENE